jgi:hypothetical protein
MHSSHSSLFGCFKILIALMCSQMSLFTRHFSPWTMRIILAGVLGGIVMFIWTSIAHMVLPLGETGIREIPNESRVLAALHDNLG